jgi:hAT family C-terminal dimerisation region
MAMDYLPIQASAVSCERVFSSSAETDTKKRNRISPVLMESLQMLKYHLKKERLNFTDGWSLSEKELIEDAPEEDMLCKLLGDNFQDALDRIMQSINTYE